MYNTLLATTETSLIPMARDYAAYNLWANTTLLQWLYTFPADLLDQEVPSSFRSLRKTLFHICLTEQAWLAAMEGKDMSGYYHQQFEGSAEELKQTMLRHSRMLASYAESLDDEEMLERCHFRVPVRWPEWDDFYRPRYEIIQHCITHSTYHRGQVITIAHQLGMTGAPMTDYMYYLLLVKDQES